MKLMLKMIKTALLFFIFMSSAYAHTDSGTLQNGFISGFLHPIMGLDHVIAMIAVGLWGVFLGRPAIWVLPIVFP